MPLLLRGLELVDFNIRADVIDTFLAAAEGDASEQSLVSEHASTLVTYMLKNSMVNLLCVGSVFLSMTYAFGAVLQNGIETNRQANSRERTRPAASHRIRHAGGQSSRDRDVWR